MVEPVPKLRDGDQSSSFVRRQRQGSGSSGRVWPDAPHPAPALCLGL